MAFTWQVDPTIAYPDLFDNYARVIFQSGNRVAHQRAREMQAWGRTNAPWTDRSGRARGELSVRVEGDEFGIGTIIAEHGPPWGLFLEVSNQSRFAILAPMIDVFAPILWRDLQRIMNLGIAAR